MISFPKLVMTLAITAVTGLVGNVQADRDEKDTRSAEFERIATFPVYLNTDINLETVAEIIDVSEDGRTLVYTDSPTENIGFIDIQDPEQPQADGIVGVGGEPTSVAVSGNYALVAVNTSVDFVNTSGYLHVIDMQEREIVVSLDMQGQPDSVAVSPDGRYAAVVIENERDEDIFVNGIEGGLPQLPSGFLQIIHMRGHPMQWTTRQVDLDGLADIAPTDAEPEFVDINERNIAAITLQENNHIVYVDGLTPVGQDGSFPLVSKKLARDILPDLQAPRGWVQDKPEGLAVSADGRVYMVTDNDGVDGATGETQFQHLGDAESIFNDAGPRIE